MANYSPLSSENHRSLFVKPTKRGKQRAGGEALFPSPHLPHHREIFSQTQVAGTSQNTKNETKVFFL